MCAPVCLSLMLSLWVSLTPKLWQSLHTMAEVAARVVTDRRHEYDVAISFAGEDRLHAEALATILRNAGVSVFYDVFEQDRLWGKDLFQHLATIYGERAEYCVVFVSQSYLHKSWTKHELKQAQARSFTIDREYILPIRLDDTNLPGLAPTIGYLDLRHTPIDKIALMLQRKLGRPADEAEREADRLAWNGELIDYNGVPIASFWPKQIEQAQHRPAYLVTSVFTRIPYGEEVWPDIRRRRPRMACGDCAALPGQFHVPSCDMEQCPACRGQAIGCGCIHEPITRNEIRHWEDEGEMPDET